jgi:hypothetical protein
MTRLARILAVALLALAAATPAAAQFGIKKKLPPVPGAEKAKPAAAPAAAGGGGTLVLDDEVIERMIKGMRAAKAYREDAAKANTPYGRHMQAKAAYAEAQPKCEEGRATYPTRFTADPKLQKKSEVYMDRFMAAQEKQDTAAMRIWGDSIAVLQGGPACAVKDPATPNDFYDQQQAVEEGASKAELDASEFDGRESGQAKERAIGIIQDRPPPDVSPSEQQAVDKREKELKDLMGLNPPPQARTPKPAPAAAAAPAAAPAPTVDPGQQAAAECMSKNAKKNEKDIERLGNLAAAAANGGDVAKAMVYADSINQLQSAGCNQ